MLRQIGVVLLRFLGVFALCSFIQPLWADVSFNSYQMEQNILDAAQIVQDLAIISGIFMILGGLMLLQQ